MTRVDVRPELLRWARERIGDRAAALRQRYPQSERWERGDAKPTLKQLEAFAKAACVPIGYLFLPEPPVERVPIPDFRTIATQGVERPSPDLLDTVYLCQQRQEWYRNYAIFMGEDRVRFVGSVRVEDDISETAATIRDALGFDIEERRQFPTWTEALRRFIEQADELGVLVMVSGVVGSNNKRKLDPDEFRGFAITDELAPLVFINGADTKAAQMFTLAHELAHIWLGQSAVSDSQASSLPSHRLERWCNKVAAELLVPLEVLRKDYYRHAELHGESNRLARRFKVSTLVIFRRMHDAGGLTTEQFRAAYKAELARLRTIPKGSGGDFYLTLGARVSKRLARAMVISTLEGQTSFTETFRMLGFKKMKTFQELGSTLGIEI